MARSEDLATAIMSKDHRDKLCEDELVKLQVCGVFEVCDPDGFIRGSRGLYPRWVDTRQKSRLTSADADSRNAPGAL